MGSVKLYWSSNRELCWELSFPASDADADAEQREAWERLGALPADGALDLSCQFGVEEEDQLAAILTQLLKALSDRCVTRWELHLERPLGRVWGDLKTIFGTLPNCSQALICGHVNHPLLSALVAGKHQAIQSMELLECGPNFTSCEVLYELPHLATLLITGANNVRPPRRWEGGDRVIRISIRETTNLTTKYMWTRYLAGRARKVQAILDPAMRGVMNAPAGYAAPNDLDLFEDDTVVGCSSFVASTNCASIDVGRIVTRALNLPSTARMSTVSFELIQWLGDGLALDWLPADAPLPADMPAGGELILKFPRIDGLADELCDQFAERAMRLVADRPSKSATFCFPCAPARLLPWKWLCERSGARLRFDASRFLGRARHGENQKPIPVDNPISEEGELILDLARSEHGFMLELLATRPELRPQLNTVEVRGEGDRAALELVKQLLELMPDCDFRLEATWTSGLERALLTMYESHHQRMQLSGETREQLEKFNEQQESYKISAQWALGEEH